MLREPGAAVRAAVQSLSRVRLFAASVPPSCSMQGGVLFSPYGAERGTTHLALEGMETLLPWLPQGHQLDTSLGDKTTGSV